MLYSNLSMKKRARNGYVLVLATSVIIFAFALIFVFAERLAVAHVSLNNTCNVFIEASYATNVPEALVFTLIVSFLIIQYLQFPLRFNYAKEALFVLIDESRRKSISTKM